jgi:predicted  nucleic acid-binding Zn-ribbon protein
MEQELAALKRLQRIDEQRDQLHRRKSQLPQRVDAARNDVTSREQLRHDVEERIRQHRHEIDRQELDLKSREEHIGRLRGQLVKAKTNREYQAFLGEIQSLETDASRLEESILEAMTETDDLKVSLGDMASHVQEASKELEAVQQTVDEEVRSLDADLTKLDQDRAGVAELIDPEHLQVYERLRGGITGRVVVPVRGELCEGCHMPVMPQTINLLMSNRDLVTCHRCGRILYLDQPDEETQAAGE